MKHALAPTRARLIRSAIALFQAHGYFAVSVNDILVDAQAPKGSLYHHFPAGKSDLARAAVASIRADVLAWMQKARTEAMPPSLALRSLATEMAAWLRQSEGAQGSLFSVLALECATREPTVHAAVKAAYADWRNALSDLIPSEADHAQSTASLIIATLEGGLILARAEGSPAPLLDAADRLAALL